MNQLTAYTSDKTTLNFLFKTGFFYLFTFLLFYSEPISVGGRTIGVLWKIAFLGAIALPVMSYILRTKKIELFVLFGILLSIKMFFNLSSFEYFNSTISIVAKNLMFPMLFLFFIIKLNVTQLIYLAKHFSIFVVLSFVPFLLGILKPISEGYSLAAFGEEDAFGLVGVFGGSHGASEALGMTLILLFYFFQKEKSKSIKIIYLGLLGLGSLELILTYARSGILLAAIGIFYLWIKEKGSKKFITAMLIFVPIIFMSIYMYITNPVFKMRINDENIYNKQEFGSGRPTIYINALNNWYEEDIVVNMMGLGFEYGTIKMYQAIGNKIFAHNAYLQTLQQEGIIGMMFFLLYLYYLFKFILKHKNNKYYFITMALFLAYLMEMIVQGNFVFFMFLYLAIFLTMMQKTDGIINE